MGEQRQGEWTISAADQAAVVERLRRTDLGRRERERLEMVKGAAADWDRATIAAWSGCTEATVVRWLTMFGTGGIAALRDAPRCGRPRKADAAYRAALEQTVAIAPPTLGLPFDVWTSGRLSAYLAETTGVRIAPGWVRALLSERTWVCGRPKHTLHHLQDPDEVAACEQVLADLGEKGGRPSRAV